MQVPGFSLASFWSSLPEVSQAGHFPQSLEGLRLGCTTKHDFGGSQRPRGLENFCSFSQLCFPRALGWETGELPAFSSLEDPSLEVSTILVTNTAGGSTAARGQGGASRLCPGVGRELQAEGTGAEARGRGRLGSLEDGLCEGQTLKSMEGCDLHPDSKRQP